MRQWVGSILFTLYHVLVRADLRRGRAADGAVAAPRTPTRVAIAWVDSVLWLLRVLCRLDYRVEGREHLPARNGVVLLKHSSAWETIAQLRIFPPQTWVLKRELMWVPDARLGAVAAEADRDRPARRRRAVQQVLEQGHARLADGLVGDDFPRGHAHAGRARRGATG